MGLSCVLVIEALCLPLGCNNANYDLLLFMLQCNEPGQVWERPQGDTQPRDTEGENQATRSAVKKPSYYLLKYCT